MIRVVIKLGLIKMALQSDFVKLHRWFAHDAANSLAFCPRIWPWTGPKGTLSASQDMKPSGRNGSIRKARMGMSSTPGLPT